MRKLMIGGIVAVIVLGLVACGNEAPDAAAEQARMQSDYWQIDQIEKDFHDAMTMKDIDLMMSLCAPNATMTVGPGATASGLGRDPSSSGWRRPSPFEPAEPLGLGSPRVQARDHGQRRPGHVALRVPLHRYR